jgi:hypothetical protein
MNDEAFFYEETMDHPVSGEEKSYHSEMHRITLASQYYDMSRNCNQRVLSKNHLIRVGLGCGDEKNSQQSILAFGNVCRVICGVHRDRNGY